MIGLLPLGLVHRSHAPFRMLITWLSPGTWHVLIADDKKHGSLHRPIDHKNIEHELQIRHLLQKWNNLPIQINDGDFTDLVLLVDVDSRLDLLFYTCLAQVPFYV